MMFIFIAIAFVLGFFVGKLMSEKKESKAINSDSKKNEKKDLKQSASNTVQKNIYIGNLSHAMSEKDLIETFEVFGKVERASIVKDRNRGSLKRFAFVEMTTSEDAASAVSSLNGREVKGRVLKVSFAHDRSSKGNNRNYRRKYPQRRNNIKTSSERA